MNTAVIQQRPGPGDVIAANYYPFGVAIIAFCSMFFPEWYYSLAITLLLFTVVAILDKLGKGIVLREIIALHSTFVCVFMPEIGYHIYNKDNLMARIWVKYMPIPESVYMAYALPAISCFIIALCWPVRTGIIGERGRPLRVLMDKIKERVQGMQKISITIVIVGMTVNLISSFLPAALRFVGDLFFWSSFPGILYIFYTSKLKQKKWLLLGFTAFIVVRALQNGMFTLIAYMGMTLFSFLFLGRRMPFWRKLFAFAAGVFILLMVQSVKNTYRAYIWKAYEGNNVVLFADLVGQKLTHLSELFNEDAFFPFYYRTNQGLNVAAVMRRFPTAKPYDGGANIGLALASALVPRLLWPDKPEAGGAFNMEYYAGIQLSAGWSTNVGPLGEAYGSFGREGGILYMIALGLFLRWAYKRVFLLSYKVPFLVLWIPVLFYQITYSAESDSLQIFNSLIKSAFFIWLLTKLLPQWFDIPKKKKKVRHRPTPLYT
jgi:hypothetical protein